ncbi:phage tail protein [Janthinobacterium lividum]|uniref:phage tail protein n=1 Tax=Janthinobacterium lividum TaxID=29581 RepID=UPI001B836C47|nr:phage tail protein [Janthinobacterium lividum]MBR7631824.1 phage tail protein [Janthinobacterium lividum]
MSTYFAILTEVGEAKLANAIALGQTLKLKTMAVGDGNGNLPMPSRTQKALVHEVRRAGLNQLTVDPANISQIIVEQVLPEDVGGWWIREIGIFDEAGDLCAVANCPPSYKPLMAEGSGRTQVVRIVLIVASTAAIELKIDPSVILATRKYVDDQDITVRAYSDTQLAKHLAALDPHPLLAHRTYVDQKDAGTRAYVEQQGKDVAAYGDLQLTRHLAALDVHPTLARSSYVDQQVRDVVAYVDRQDDSARTYGNEQLANHQAATDPHPLLAKVTFVDQQVRDVVAYVDRQDNNVVAHGDQQLAKHAAAADPHPQYSMKEVATPPKFDASNKLVNADFVQKSQGNMVRYSHVLESRTLTAEDMGCALYFPYPGKTFTIPDPASLGIPPNSGKCVRFFGVAYSGTILAAPGVVIGFDVGSVQNITIKPGQYLTLMETGPNAWQVIESTAELWRNADFASRLLPDGDLKLPGDFIMQWGSVTAGPAGTRVAFQFAFPKQCLRVFLTVSNGNYPGYVSSDSPTIAGFNAYAAADASANFLAIGK